MTDYKLPAHVATSIARRQAAARSGGCIYGCTEPAHLYPGGRFCDTHAPGPQPTPDPTRTAAALRDQGTAQVDANTDPAWKQQVDRAIAQFAASQQPFTADDVRALGIPDPTSPNAWGARFLAAAKAGQIRRIGSQPSRRASVHAHHVAVWQGAA